MAIIFFSFLHAEEPRLAGRTRVFAILAAAGFLALAVVPAASAGLIPTGKDRAQGDTLFQQAGTAYQNGDLAGAIHLLEQADTLKPDQADAWNLRGVVYLKQRAYDKAEAAFARSVAIDPALWAAQFNLAEVSFQKKDYQRARTVFERLLAQTDRYKSSNKWELIQYKAFLCALLSGDEADARKKLAKLPVAGGATPAALYAQAALAFSRKDTAGGNRIVNGAQTAYAPALNEIFANSLENAGWRTPAPAVNPLLPGATLAVANVDPATAAAMSAAGITNPAGVTTPAPGRTAAERPAVMVDPRQVAASDPLPSGPGRDLIPAVGQMNSLASGRTVSNSAKRPAKEKPAPSPAPGTLSVGSPVPAATPPASPLEHEGLLLGLD